jgi:hypothetical protein
MVCGFRISHSELTNFMPASDPVRVLNNQDAELNLTTKSFVAAKIFIESAIVFPG